MKRVLVVVMLFIAAVANSQTDYETQVTLKLKNGQILTCRIDQIKADTIYITRINAAGEFKGTVAVSDLDEKSFYKTMGDLYPSNALIKAGNQMIGSYVLTAVGGTLAVLGIDKDGKVGPVSYVGMGLGVVGLILNISGISNITKAGKKLRQIHIDCEGVKYRF